MKKLYGVIIASFIVLLTGCEVTEPFEGSWYYKGVDEETNLITEVTFNIGNHNYCNVHSKLTDNGEEALDRVRYCNWEKDGDFVIYRIETKEEKLYYDKKEDKLFYYDQEKNEKTMEFERVE